ncbi:Uncharacterised protein [Mycobacterium tuberculosis]|nr:Uncharacterised protein [Mycobacterium tuberculosis]
MRGPACRDAGNPLPAGSLRAGADGLAIVACSAAAPRPAPRDRPMCHIAAACLVLAAESTVALKMHQSISLDAA